MSVKNPLKPAVMFCLALMVGLFIPLNTPSTASASSVVFSNLGESARTNPIMRANIPAGMQFTADSDSVISRIRWQMGSSDDDDIKARIYTSTNNRPSSFLGELTQSNYDSATKIRTYTGSVEVSAGNFWIVFQCAFCSNQNYALTTSKSKTGAWSNQFAPPVSDPSKVFWLTDSGSGLVTPTGSYAYGESLVLEVTASPALDTTSPTLLSSSPADNGTGVLTSADLSLTFSEAIAPGTGNIAIYKSSDPSTAIQTVDVNSGAVTTSGSVVTVNWPADLEPGTQYFVLVDATAVEDASENAFAGISSSSSLDFTTIAAPAISSSSPPTNSENVPNNSNIVLNFSRAVTGVTGKNITLVNLDTSATTVIAADDAQVSASGSAVTINPTTDLEISTNYAVTFDAGAFVDGDGIGVDALSDQTVFNFKTAKVPFAGLEVALDASILSSYSGTGDVWADISGNNNDLKLDAIPDPISDPKVLPSFNNVDKALVFDASEGQHGYFWDGTNPTLDLLNEAEYTKLVWFKPTGLTNSNNLFSSALKNAHALWGGGNDGTCALGGGDNLASGHNGDWRTVQSGECLETEWQMVAVSFDSDPNSDSAGWRMFRNGSLVGDSADTVEITDGSNGTTNRMGYETLIGSYNYGNFFDGEIGQVYLYGRALGASEINSIFEASAAQYGLNLKTVTFDANGGTIDISSLKSNAGDGQVTLRTPSKANATFLGWYTQSSGGTRVGGAGDSYTPASDVTLFAQWDHTYTVTYSAGTNATGAPATATFQESVGAIALPTPSRADYVFEGWFTASSGGTKVGNAGQAFTPNADLTLHGRWTQASLAGIAEADRTLVNTAIITNGVSSSNTLSIGSSSVSITIPGNAFATGVEVRTYSVANHNKAQALLPNESDFVNSMVVAWTAPDTTVPVANSPLTMVITDASIKAGAKVFSIVGNQSTLLATATQDGQVTISFTTDPLITIANPVIVPPPSSGGGGGGGSAPAPAPVVTEATKIPTLLADQEVTLDAGVRTTLTLEGENLDLITTAKVGEQELEFEASNDGEAITLSLLVEEPGTKTLSLLYADGNLEQLIVIREVKVSKVNAGSFNGVVALYAKGYIGQRLSAKVGKDWVIVESLADDYVRITEPTRWVGKALAVRIYINRKLVNTIDVVTK